MSAYDKRLQLSLLAAKDMVVLVDAADGEDGASRRELLEEHRLGDLGGQVAHIEAGHGVVRAGLLGPRGRSSLHCSHFLLGFLSQTFQLKNTNTKIKIG